MEEEYILLYFTEGRYPGFQRKHIKYFTSFMYLESYVNRHPKIARFYVFQKLNINPIGKQQSL